MERAQRGDIVYCDPPYTPLSETAYFTAYSAGGFGWQEQAELAQMAQRLARRGVQVVISNHDTRGIRELYAGARIFAFPVRRSISRDGSNRGEAAEILAVFE